MRIWNGPVAPEDPAAVARWQAFDVEHGLPRLPDSQVEHWTPQQLSLERLGAFSVKKGCYPGQEIVARTHFLGQAKRGLALLEGTAQMPVAADVNTETGALGKVIASVADGGRHLPWPCCQSTTRLRACRWNPSRQGAALGERIGPLAACGGRSARKAHP